MELERPVSLDKKQSVVKTGGTLWKAVKQINDDCRGTEHKGGEILTCSRNLSIGEIMCVTNSHDASSI